jgi:phosphoserine phosphatase RsbU/P
VAKPVSPRKHLKLYTEQPTKRVRPALQNIASLPGLLRAFQSATGWALHYLPDSAAQPLAGLAWSTPVAAGPAGTSGYLALERPAGEIGAKQNDIGVLATSPASELTVQEGSDRSDWSGSATAVLPTDKVSRDSARKLAGSIADLLSELLETRQALWQREAELAAGVPLVPQREDQEHLATRLEAALRAGAEAVGGDAIALYLLDEATTELKLRSSWGLPFDRLTAPPRPLQGAMADLEALLGHAVVLNDDGVVSLWNMPEDFPAAVCVSVSTPTVLLGTLWLFSKEKRAFSDQQTNILEVVAGRVATDLEREMLMRAGTDGAQLQKQMATAERLQCNGLPTISPLLEGWEAAGWTTQAEGVGGAFHDWFCLPRGLLAVAVGKADQTGMAGALTASTVKTAARAHARYHAQAERIVGQANLTLWTCSAGDQRASLFCGLIETATGRVCCASAGQLLVLRLHTDGCESLSQSGPPLGESPENDFEQFGYELDVGDALVICTGALANPPDAQGRPLGDGELVEALHGKSHLSADELVAVVHELRNIPAAPPRRNDFSVVVIKRTTP